MFIGSEITINDLNEDCRALGSDIGSMENAGRKKLLDSVFMSKMFEGMLLIDTNGSRLLIEK